MSKNNLLPTGTAEYRNCPNCACDKFRIKYLEQDFAIVKCKNCSLVYLANPPDTKTLYESYYDEIIYNAADYRPDSGDKRLSTLFAINEQRLEFIKKEKRRSDLLDVGCGFGFFLKTACDAGYSTTGIDASAKAIEYARSEFGINAGNETLEDMVKKGLAFDIITLWHVLEHFLNPLDELIKIRKLLGSGGICYVEVPNLDSLKFKASRQKWSGGNHPKYHRSFFTAKTLELTLKKAGFSPINRIRASYKTPEMSVIYIGIKRLLNWAALDSFLIFSAEKE